MATVVMAVWEPAEPALEHARQGGARVDRALADQGPYRGSASFEVFVRADLDNPAGFAYAELGGRVWAWTVDEHRPRVGTEPCAVTMVALMQRGPGRTHDEFARHWTECHTPLALAHHTGLHDYTQNVVTATLTPGIAEVDGVAELGFRTRADFETRFFDSDEGRRAIFADVDRFMVVPGPATTLVSRH